MLIKRILASTVIIAVFVAVLAVDDFLAPWFPLWVFLAGVVSVWTTIELVGLLSRTSAKPSGPAALAGVVALVVANWLPHVADALWQPRFPVAGGQTPNPAGASLVLAWPMWAFVGILMTIFIAESRNFKHPGRTMATIAGTLLAVAYVGLLGSFLIQLRWHGGPREGLVAVLALIATAKGADIGAYTCGRMFGRTKLWPELSPNKTIEGSAGGLVFGVAGTALVMVAAEYVLLGRRPLNWPGTLVFGLVVTVASMLGDLMESMIKRDCEQKDASDAIPGFGGLLDVMDSLLFAAPVAYALWLVLARVG
jgi:phosphatidate cytidylyltransferase